MWADQGHASDGAPEASAALAGVDGGREGVTVRVNDSLIQAGVTDGTAGVRRDGIGALDRTRPLLAVHDLILNK